MTMHMGPVPAGTTLYIPFTTYAGSTGASVTLTGLAVTDIEVYKNGSTTQRASDAGFALLDTDGIDFDGITGLHGFSIDLNDNTDSGFYAVGSQYWVVVSAVTVDSQTVNFIAATFRIAPAEGVTGYPSVNTTHAAGTAWGSSAITAASLASDAGTEIAAAVWDRVITGANHNITNSAGKRLRELTNSVVTSGTAQGGATASITLASAASSVDGTYDPAIVRISGGTGIGQARQIIQYVGSTRVASVDRDWRVAPDNTSEYEIIAGANLISTNEGLAQGGGASTITLNANASATDNVYVGQTIVLRTGTGQDQSRVCSAYNGTTKVATVSTAWETNPASGTGYIMWPLGRSRVAAVESAAITAIQSGLASQTSVDDLPTNAELATALAAADDAVLSAVGTVDTVVDAIKVVTDQLADTLEDQGGGVYGFTADALQEAPSGSGLDAAGVRDAIGLASANLDTQLADLPTNSELTTALGTADDAVLAAIDALPTATENADALLNRDMSAVSDTNARSPLNALRFLRNKWSLSGTTLTVTKENDSTSAWTAAVTAAPGADPISGSDPA
jgi:hypothetical protein